MTLELLRRLANVQVRPGPLVSMYLDLDPRDTLTPGDVQSRVHSLVRGLEQRAGSLDHEQRVSLIDDVGRLRRYADGGVPREGARALAVFAAASSSLWEEVRLSTSVPDRIVVDRELHVAPLVQVAQAREALVAFANRRRGSLYRVVNGSIEHLAELTDDDVPSRHDQGGWSQANYQRHIDELAAQHLRTVADELDRRFRDGGRPPVVMVCPDEDRSELGKLLSSEVASSVVGWTTVEAHAHAPAIAEAVRPLVARHRAEEDRDVLARYREELGQNRQAARGWQDTFEALVEGRVDRLLYDQNASRMGHRCPSCRRPYSEPGTCIVDGETLEPTDALNLAILRTLTQGGVPMPFVGRPELDGEEICALLRW
jgi:peptide chain release factor subunit 1